MKRKVLWLIGVCFLITCFSACANSGAGNGEKYVKLELESGEEIVMELFPDVAPKTVGHFLKNVKSGYYDGKVFHRAVKGSIIQAGSEDGQGHGGSGERVKGEFKANGVENNLKHTRGIVSLARATDYNSGSAQFFIVQAATPHLDGQYAAFGRVISGMEVVDRIAELPVGGAQGDEIADKPVIRTAQALKEDPTKVG